MLSSLPRTKRKSTDPSCSAAADPANLTQESQEKQGSKKKKKKTVVDPMERVRPAWIANEEDKVAKMHPPPLRQIGLAQFLVPLPSANSGSQKPKSDSQKKEADCLPYLRDFSRLLDASRSQQRPPTTAAVPADKGKASAAGGADDREDEDIVVSEDDDDACMSVEEVPNSQTSGVSLPRKDYAPQPQEDIQAVPNSQPLSVFSSPLKDSAYKDHADHHHHQQQQDGAGSPLASSSATIVRDSLWDRARLARDRQALFQLALNGSGLPQLNDTHPGAHQLADHLDSGASDQLGLGRHMLPDPHSIQHHAPQQDIVGSHGDEIQDGSHNSPPDSGAPVGGLEDGDRRHGALSAGTGETDDGPRPSGKADPVGVGSGGAACGGGASNEADPSGPPPAAAAEGIGFASVEDMISELAKPAHPLPPCPAVDELAKKLASPDAARAASAGPLLPGKVPAEKRLDVDAFVAAYCRDLQHADNPPSDAHSLCSHDAPVVPALAHTPNALLKRHLVNNLRKLDHAHPFFLLDNLVLCSKKILGIHQ
jgi:hypothetical protein